MNPREFLQLASVAMSIWLLVEVALRIRRYHDVPIFYQGDSLRSWSAFIAIGVVTSAYYLVVWYDSYVRDIFVAGDWSAGLRLFVTLALIIHVHYQPRNRP